VIIGCLKVVQEKEQSDQIQHKRRYYNCV